jgi:hypothetical protein
VLVSLYQGFIDHMLMWSKLDPDLERRNIRAVKEWAQRAEPLLYAPRWMLQRAVRVMDAAIKGEEIGSGLVLEFDAATVWKKWWSRCERLSKIRQRGSRSGRRRCRMC